MNLTSNLKIMISISMRHHLGKMIINSYLMPIKITIQDITDLLLSFFKTSNLIKIMTRLWIWQFSMMKFRVREILLRMIMTLLIILHFLSQSLMVGEERVLLGVRMEGD